MAKLQKGRHLKIFTILVVIVHITRCEENMALSQPAEQSSDFNSDWVAPNAVDGCLSQNVFGGCCIHTLVDRSTVWWRVNLEELVAIDRITIYYRSGFEERLAGYWLYVSNTTDFTQGVICYQDTSTSKSQVQNIQTQACPYVAQYVTVYNERQNPKRHNFYSNTAVLELCEVQVYGCPVGWYGTGNCNIQCSANCLGGTCDPISGNCTYCAQEKYGGMCENNCSSNCLDSICNRDTGYCGDCIVNRYGLMCEQTCPAFCLSSPCDRLTGDCIGACIDGKHGVKCDQDCPVNCLNLACNKGNGTCIGECDAGYYGDTCSQSCPATCAINTCTKDSGNCIGGCVDGTYGPRCEFTCPTNCKDMICEQTNGDCLGCNDGVYDTKCTQTCPSNCKNTICEQTNGNCVACVDGTYGEKCGTACPQNCGDGTCRQGNGYCFECSAGTYGDICETACPQNCNGGICQKDNGYCSGCNKGYTGNDCSTTCRSNCTECQQNNANCTECLSGLFGHICTVPCGNCELCEINNGVCTSECFSGWEGPTCQQVIAPPTPPDNTAAIAGAVVGAALLVIIVIIVVIVVRRRRAGASKAKRLDEPRTREFSPKKSFVGVTDETAKEPAKSLENVYVNTAVNTKDEAEENVYYNTGPVGTPIGDLKSIVATKMKNKSKAFVDEYGTLPAGAVHPHEVGKLPQNKPKNRFKTTFPYDHSRVVLNKLGKDPHSDYINANYIDGVNKKQEYIATQGPKPGTLDDFWRMMWQMQSGKIIMLTNLVEGGRHKCDKYWPEEGEPLATTHFDVMLDRERTYAFYVIRDITLTEKKTKDSRQIHQYHYTTWPDHGTPDPNELVVFHRRVKQCDNALPGKMVVHCSAGIGRTGTFIALDALLEYGKEYGRVDVLEYIKTMRKDRVNMVQTSDQYIAIHHLLIEAFNMPDTLISKANFNTKLKALSNGGPSNQTQVRKEFQMIRSLAPTHSEEDNKAALSPDNKDKNRTLSILAADKYRAYLSSSTDDRTDYINGVIVPSYIAKSGYIVTQVPLADTVIDLWTMVTDYSCETIVVIQKENIEWLPKEGTAERVGVFTVTKTAKTSTISTVQIMEIELSNETDNSKNNIRIFHMTSWDSGSLTPTDSSCLLQLLELVESRRKSNNSVPTVVMCRDGCSQSGLFCCISNARDQIKIDEEVDIYQAVRQLIVRRPQIVSNFEQYQYCYRLIREYLDTTDVYMN